TAGTFIVGWLAIAGVPPFAGFWSKDEILLYAFDANPVLWGIGLVTALLTAFYMSRQVFMVFFGEERFHEEAAPVAANEAAEAEAAHATADAAPHDDHGHHGDPHESPWLMTVPLILLSGLAVVGGALNLPFTPDLHF